VDTDGGVLAGQVLAVGSDYLELNAPTGRALVPPIDPPYTPPSDLDRGQGPRADQGIDLWRAHTQIGRHVLEREEAGLDLGARGIVRRRHVPKDSRDWRQIHEFDDVCSRLGTEIVEGGRDGRVFGAPC
jgi:hypothetical protein